MVEAFRHLGYPDYFRMPLGGAKLLGVIALLTPRVPGAVSEWRRRGLRNHADRRCGLSRRKRRPGEATGCAAGRAVAARERPRALAPSGSRAVKQRSRSRSTTTVAAADPEWASRFANKALPLSSSLRRISRDPQKLSGRRRDSRRHPSYANHQLRWRRKDGDEFDSRSRRERQALRQNRDA